MRIFELLDRTLDILWPRRCMFCGGRPEGRGTVCEKCAEKLPFIPADNKRIPVEFTAGCACALWYEGGVRDAVHRYKYGGSWHYFRHFSALMAARGDRTKTEGAGGKRRSHQSAKRFVQTDSPPLFGPP